MKNVLTYHFGLEDYSRTQDHLNSAWGVGKFVPLVAPDVLVLTFLFRKTLQQHGWTMGGDIKFQTSEVGRADNNTTWLEQRVDLTFKDEATALLFKLSHDGVAA